MSTATVRVFLCNRLFPADPPVEQTPFNINNDAGDDATRLAIRTTLESFDYIVRDISDTPAGYVAYVYPLIPITGQQGSSGTFGNVDISGTLTLDNLAGSGNRPLLVNNLGQIFAVALLAGVYIDPDFGSTTVKGGDFDIAGNVVIAGDLTVNGTTTTVNSTVVDIADRVIHLNSHAIANVPVPALITGIEVERGDTAGVKRDGAALLWREASSYWQFAKNTGVDDTTVGADLAIRALGATLSGLGGSGSGFVGVDNVGLLSFLAFSSLVLVGDVTGPFTANHVDTITGTGGLTTVASATSLAFVDATPAAGTGKIRVAKNFTMKSRNAADSLDAFVLQLDGANNLYVGDGSLTGTLTLRAASGMDILAGQIALETAGNMYLDAAAHHFRDAAHAEFLSLVGPTAAPIATTGVMRAAKSFSIKTRDSGDANDANLIAANGSDQFSVGDLSRFSDGLLAAQGTLSIRTASGYINLLTGAGAPIYYDADLHHLRSQGGAGLADLTTSALSTFVPIKLNSAAGAFPAIGNIRSKNIETIIAGEYSGSDFGLMSWNTNTLIFGGTATDTNTVNSIQLDALTAWGMYKPGVSTFFYWTSGDYTQQFYYLDAGPTIKHRGHQGDQPPYDFTCIPQAPYSAATGANRKPGSWVIDIPSPTNSGTAEGSFKVSRVGSSLMVVKAYDSAPSYSGIWFQGNESTPANYAFLGNATETYLSAPGGTIHFSISDSERARMSTGAFSFGTGASTPQYTFDLSATATLHFDIAAMSAEIVYDAKTTDVPTVGFKWSGQDAYASATGTNRNGGNLWLRPGLKAAGGIDGAVQFGQSGFATIGTATGVSLLLPYDAEIRFRDVAGTGNIGGIYMTGNVLYLGSYSTGAAFPNSVYTYASGQIHWVSGGSDLYTNGNGLVFDQGVALTIKQEIRSSDAATHDFVFQAQAPFASATGTNRNPGDFVVSVPAKIGAPVHNGGFAISYTTDKIVTMGEYQDSGNVYGAIWFGAQARAMSGTNWAFLGGGGSTYFNSVSGMYFGQSANYVVSIQPTQMFFAGAASYSNPSYYLDFSATAVFHFGVDATSAKIVFDAKGTDIATDLFWVSGQNAYASATGTNRIGGDLTITQGSGVGGQFDGTIQIGRQLGNLQMLGGLMFDTNGVTSSNFSVTRKTGFVYVDTTSSAITVTLPDPAEGARFVCVIDDAGNASAHNITIARNGSEKINGASASDTIDTDWGVMMYISNGTDWRKLL